MKISKFERHNQCFWALPIDRPPPRRDESLMSLSILFETEVRQEVSIGNNVMMHGNAHARRETL